MKILVFLFMAFPLLAISAQNNTPYYLTRINGEITLDGKFDEPAWQSIQPLPLVTYQPVYKSDPSEKTIIKIGYDDNYFYAAGMFYMEDPSQVRNNTMYRDRYSGDDVFHIIFDPYNDNENGRWFAINPNGVRLDGEILNDFYSGVNFDWNTYWDVQTIINDEGWFAEVRIPFSSLGFQNIDGKVTMGLTINRYIASKIERHIFPDVEPISDNEQFRPSVGMDIVLEGLESSTPLYITPYGLVGYQTSNSLSDEGTAYKSSDKFERELGLDLKYALSSKLTLDLTVNTDFAQVEADDFQVNLTRFSLFFPEKRQFFQERSSVFSFNTGGNSRVFHSRRIGLTDEGEQVRIFGGARLTGRIGSWDVGLMSLQEAGHSGTSSENFGVVRLKKEMINANSYVGAIAANRIDFDGSRNTTIGIDGLINVFDDDYLTVRFAQSHDSDDEFDFVESSRIFADWERRRSIGLGYSFGIVRSGKNYNPEMGFVARNNFTLYYTELKYGWLFEDDSWLRKIQPWGYSEMFTNNETGVVESGFLGNRLFFESKSGMTIALGQRTYYENIETEFGISDDVTIPVGKYWFFYPDVEIIFPEGWKFIPNLFFAAGEFYDGNRYNFNLNLAWYISEHIELGAVYDLNYIEFDGRNLNLTSHLARLRINLALNTEVSLQSFIQYNSLQDVIGINTRFRYNFSEGNDLYFVYNENVNTDRYREFPILPFSSNRVFLLKYTYTFIN